MFDSARVLSVLGESYLELELYDKAIEAFVRHRGLLRHQNDDRVRLLAQLTLAYRRLGRSADATNCFRECDSLSSKLSPARLPTLVVLSEAYLSNGEAQAAMFTAQLALDLAGKTVPAQRWGKLGLLALGRAQLELGQLERAAAGLQKALELLDTPTDRRLESADLAAADVLGKLGQPQAAQTSRQIRQDYLRERFVRAAPPTAHLSGDAACGWIDTAPGSACNNHTFMGKMSRCPSVLWGSALHCRSVDVSFAAAAQ